MRSNAFQIMVQPILEWMMNRINVVNENGEIIDISYFDTYNKSTISQRDLVDSLSSQAFVWESPIVDVLGNVISFLQNVGSFGDKEGRYQIVYEVELKKIMEFWRKKSSSISSNLGSLSGYCNCECEFCYEKDSPLNWHKDILTFEEAKTRICHYDKNNNKGIISPIRKSMEPFTNPHIFDILELIRLHSTETISLVTNGSYLTEENIKRLAQLKPINISLSLNSSSHETRRKVMKDKSPEVAVMAPKLLKKYKIIYQATIVAWPTIESDDLVDTIYYLDQNGARDIVIHLPSYNQYNFSEEIEITSDYWDHIVKVVNQISDLIKTPVKTFPVNALSQNIAPVVKGVYVNSPVSFHDIRKGDIIKKINDIPVFTNLEADLLLDSFAEKQQDIKIGIQRDGVLLDKEITFTEKLYPWGGEKYPIIRPYTGIYLINDFRLKYVKDIEEILSKKSLVKNVIIYSSKLIKTYFEQSLDIWNQHYPETFKDFEIEIRVAPNTYWGGNICLGDLMVVEDYVNDLQKLINQGRNIDLVIIPSSFLLTGGLDILGVSAYKMKNYFEFDVEFLDNIQING